MSFVQVLRYLFYTQYDGGTQGSCLCTAGIGQVFLKASELIVHNDRSEKLMDYMSITFLTLIIVA